MPKMTTEQFISKSRNVHGYVYDYWKTSFINKSTPVTITCPDHGDFTVTPNSHLHGRKPSGCPRCRGRVIDTESFISKARRLHGDFYDYSKVSYQGAHDRVTIVCPDHGEFLQAPCEHAKDRPGSRPSGCPECGYEKIRNTHKYSAQDFIKKARELHGDFYDYSRVEYVDSRTPVTIVCPDHGEFQQRPASHTERNGCPACVTPGFYCEGFFNNHPEFKNKPALRYVVRFSKNDEVFYKVGITTLSVKKRFAGDDHTLEVLDIKYACLYECFQDEQNIIKSASDYSYIPENALYAGNTECFSMNPLEI